MERNFKVKKYKDVFHIQYEYYCRNDCSWNTTIFRDINNDYLEFYREKDANDWIASRIKINNN